MKSEPDLGSAEGLLNEAVENIRNNIRWMETNLPILKTWLNSKKPWHRGTSLRVSTWQC